MYSLTQVNHEDMLKAILKDFYCMDLQKVSATIHNSLLSIINRYIILHMSSFIDFLKVSGADLF